MDWPAIPLFFGVLRKSKGPSAKGRFVGFFPYPDVLPAYRFVHTSFWVSSGRTNPKVSEGLKAIHSISYLKEESIEVRWSFGNFQSRVLSSKAIHVRHYREGHFHSNFFPQDFPLAGEYLILHLFANPPRHSPDTLPDEAIGLINVFRLNCGAGGASDLAAEFFFDRLTSQPRTRVTTPEPTEVEDQFRHRVAEEGSFGVISLDLAARKLSTNAHQLLHLSLQQHNSALRFLFTWMVLELTVG